MLEQYRGLQQDNCCLAETVGQLQSDGHNLKTISSISEENRSLKELNSQLKDKVEQYELKICSLIARQSTSQKDDVKEPKTPTQSPPSVNSPSPSLPNRNSVGVSDLLSIKQSLQSLDYSGFPVLSKILKGLDQNIRDPHLTSAAVAAHGLLQSSSCPLIQALDLIRSNSVPFALKLLQGSLNFNSEYIVAEAMVLILKIRRDFPIVEFEFRGNINFNRTFSNPQLTRIVSQYLEEFNQQFKPVSAISPNVHTPPVSPKEKLLKLERIITDWVNQYKLSREETNFLRTKLNYLKESPNVPVKVFLNF
ncbi:hypothetical protein GEMRC1_011046 [Eukaryota sp. GEM-RC1]